MLHCASDSLLATRAQTEALRGRIRVVAPHASFSRGEYRYFTTPRPDAYTVETVDRLQPAGEGAFPVMRYAGGGTAAVASEGAGSGGRTFVAGFPFEALTDRVQRDRMMRDVLEFLTDND